MHTELRTQDKLMFTEPFLSSFMSPGRSSMYRNSMNLADMRVPIYEVDSGGLLPVGETHPAPVLISNCVRYLDPRRMLEREGFGSHRVQDKVTLNLHSCALRVGLIVIRVLLQWFILDQGIAISSPPPRVPHP